MKRFIDNFPTILPLILTFLISFSPAASSHAEDNGALTPDLIKHLQDGFKLDPATQAVQNAVTNNRIDSLVLNRGIIRGHDGHFTHKINFKGITDQHASGRCWMFAGFNVMRPHTMKANKLPKVEFSAAYLLFWDKLEKSNLYLEYMIEMRDTSFLDREWELVHEWTLSDGGWWNYVVNLVHKYGVVPQEIMPETHSSNNTRFMNRILEQKLKKDAVKLHEMHKRGASLDELRNYKKNALAEVYRFLVINLGEPPKQFEWRYEKTSTNKDKSDKEVSQDKGQDKSEEDNKDEKEEDSVENKKLVSTGMLTPQQFYKEYVNYNLDQYVTLYHDPVNPLMKHYEFSRSKNMAGTPEMNFVNIPMQQMQEITKNSIIDNRPVWFAADVGKDQSSKHGLMAKGLYNYAQLFNLDLELSKAQRVKYRAGASNHAMVFMGVDIRDDKPVKWLVENSWGTKSGDNGTWTLYKNWFDEHVYLVIVHRDHVPQDILKVFNEPAKSLPAWYPGAVGIQGK